MVAWDISPATKSNTVKKMQPVKVPMDTHAIMTLGPSIEAFGTSVRLLQALPVTIQQRIGLGERAQLCAAALPSVLDDLNSSQIISSTNPTGLSTIKSFQDLNAPAQGAKTVRPLLVIAGANDTTVYPTTTQRACESSCEAGNALRLSIYPELEHLAVIGVSAPEWLEFIARLFRGRGLYNCSCQTMGSFDAPIAIKPHES
ncbi:hypothetical protein BDV11DRAFT_175946 [Aspergillus similis]